MKRSEKLSVVLFFFLIIVIVICSVIALGIYRNKQREVVKEKPILSSSYQDSHTHTDEISSEGSNVSNTTNSDLGSSSNNNSASNSNVAPKESVAEIFENLWNLE